MAKLILDDLDIDSIVDLLKSAFRMEDWDKMITIADKLYLSAQLLENQTLEQQNQHNRHLVYYLGFSQLAKGIALQNKGLYSQSKMLIEKYSDLSMLEDGSTEARDEVEYFKQFAIANMLAVNVLEGNRQYLEPYVQFLKKSDISEIIVGLLNIIEAAMKHGFQVNQILELFENEINLATEYYKNKHTSYLTKLFHALVLYNLRQREYHIAIDNIIKGLELSSTFKDSAAFRKFFTLFESFSHCASENQKKHFDLIMNDVLKGELSHKNDVFFDQKWYFELIVR